MAATKIKNQGLSISLTEQDIATNNTRNGIIIKTGWSFINGDGTNANYTKAITFDAAFTTPPMVIVGMLGQRDGSDPVVIGDLVTSSNAANYDVCQAQSITTTGFNANIGTSSAGLTSGRRLGFSWIAIGT